MDSLRPLILQPDAAPYGANRALLRSITAMPAGSVRPLVVFPYAGDALDEYAAAGCEVAIEPMAVLRRSSAGLRGMADLARERRRTGEAVAALARRESCDLVHTNSMTIVSGGPAAKRAQIPHVWQLREAPRERGMRARLLGLLLGRAQCVLAVSRAAATFGPGDTRVIRDGYDLPDHRTGPQTALAHEDELLVGMIGRILPSKAPDIAIEALGCGMRLALAGTVYPGHEPYAEGLVARARSRGVSQRLDVLGWLDDPTPLLRQLDVLVIATATGEGFPGAVLEALAHGVPVVSCATGGVEELVLHERTGLVCPPGDGAAVAAALARLRDEPRLRAVLAENARQHALKFSVERSATLLLDAWQDTVTRWNASG